MPRVEVIASSNATSGPTWTYTNAPPHLGHTNPAVTALTSGPAAGAGPGSHSSSRKGGRITRHSVAGPGVIGPNYNETDDGDGAGGAGGSTKLSRKEDKLQKQLLEFEKDNNRDVQIPVPKSTQPAKSTRANKPSGGTTTTRKILASQKTLTNHLSDEASFLLQHQQQHPGVPFSQLHPAHLSAGLRASRRDPPPTIPINPAEDKQPGAGGWGLPLSHAAARADPSIKPARRFCEICGYWGKYLCMKCGTARFCSLDCKDTHEETRCQRFWV